MHSYDVFVHIRIVLYVFRLMCIHVHLQEYLNQASYLLYQLKFFDSSRVSNMFDQSDCR